MAVQPCKTGHGDTRFGPDELCKPLFLDRVEGVVTDVWGIRHDQIVLSVRNNPGEVGQTVMAGTARPKRFSGRMERGVAFDRVDGPDMAIRVRKEGGEEGAGPG